MKITINSVFSKSLAMFSISNRNEMHYSWRVALGIENSKSNFCAKSIEFRLNAKLDEFCLS